MPFSGSAQPKSLSSLWHSVTVLVEIGTEAHKTFTVFHSGRSLYVTRVFLTHKLLFVALQPSLLHSAPNKVISPVPPQKGLKRSCWFPAVRFQSNLGGRG